MAGTVIQKAIIEVKFDDLNKAQLALKSTGVEMVAFGEQAKKSGKGTDGATKSIGDLSEMLDKKLEHGLGRAFKATDRLNSIIGQFGAVAVVATTVGAALAAAFKAMTKESKASEEKLARFTSGLITQAEAAGVAKLAVEELNKSKAGDAVATTDQIIAMRKLEAAREVQAKAVEANVKATLKHRAQSRLAEEDERDAYARMGLVLEDVNAARRKHALKTAAVLAKTTEAALSAADAVYALNVATKATFLTHLPKWMQKGVQSAQQAATDITTAYRQVEYDVGNSFMAWINRVNKGQRSVVRVARESAKSLAEISSDIERAAGDERDRLGFEAEGIRMKAVEQMNADVAKSKMMVEHRDLMKELADANKEYEKAQAKAASETMNWDKVLDGATQQLESAGQAATTAAVGAAIYGDGVGAAVNDVLESIAVESISRGLFEGAMGLGALALGNVPSATLHFESAAMFGAVGVAAGAGALATGGFNGPAGGGGGDAEDAEAESDAFTGGGDTGQDRSEGRGTQETTINLNLTAGSRPLLRIEQAQMAQELRGIMGA